MVIIGINPRWNAPRILINIQIWVCPDVIKDHQKFLKSGDKYLGKLTFKIILLHRNLNFKKIINRKKNAPEYWFLFSYSLLYCDFFPSVGAWVKVGHTLKSTLVFNFCAKNRLGLCSNVSREETVSEFGSQQPPSHNKNNYIDICQLMNLIL